MTDGGCCVCARSTHTFDELAVCLKALKNRDSNRRRADRPTTSAPAVFSLRCPPCGQRMTHKDGYYRCEKCKVVV